MESLKDTIRHIKDKISAKLKPLSQVEQPVAPAEDLVIVSDYAVALGAHTMEPTGDPVQDRYHWTPRASLAPLYRTDRDGKQVPNYYLEHVEGMAPLLEDTFYHHLSVQGGFLTINKEYVYFPQRRVDAELSAKLTQLATQKVTLPESEFGPLDYRVGAHGMDIRQGVENAAYFYQGQPYCVRVDKNNLNDQVQWYQLNPVVAKWVDDKIQCEDVLVAETAYEQDRFLKDLQNSVALNHTVPLIYPRTPWPVIKTDDNPEQEITR